MILEFFRFFFKFIALRRKKYEKNMYNDIVKDYQGHFINCVISLSRRWYSYNGDSNMSWELKKYICYECIHTKVERLLRIINNVRSEFYSKRLFVDATETSFEFEAQESTFVHDIVLTKQGPARCIN